MVRSSVCGLQNAGELDLLDAKQPTPLGFIPETVLQRVVRVLLAQVNVDRFGISGFDQRLQPHRG